MRQLLLIVLMSVLTSCAQVDVGDYAEAEPRLVPEAFFDGQLRARGVVTSRSGNVIRRFTAEIKAYWVDGIGTLEEDFVFDDGELDRRVWTLTPAGQGLYRGTAGDVVGEGELRVAGNSMFLDYVLRVPWRDGSIDLRIDDRMYLIDERTLINESSMRKFGVEVGQLLLVIQRQL